MNYDWQWQSEEVVSQKIASKKDTPKTPSQRSVEKYTTFVMHEFGKFVAETFPGITVVDQLVDQLNHYCQGYQYDANKTLNPEAIKRDGKLNCITVAFIMGLWWKMSNQSLEPFYLVKQQSKIAGNEMFDTFARGKVYEKNRVHNWLTIPEGDRTRYLQGWPRIEGDDDSFSVGDVPSHLVQSALNTSRAISNTPTFFGNRVSEVRLSPSYQNEANERIGEYQHLIGNYSGMLNTLREQYLGARSST